jgi:hypothetical protein
MAGRKPDSDVLVAHTYEGKEGEEMSFTRIGAAWVNDNGMVWFNIVTNPGVRFCIKKRDEKKQEGAS